MQQRAADQTYTTLAVIWIALLASQLMFVGMVYMVRPDLRAIDTSRPILGDQPLIILGLAVLAITDIVLSFVIRQHLYKRAEAEQNSAHVQTGLVIACALCEMSSLLGVVSALALNYPYFFVFSALGILGTVLHFPRRADIVAATYRK